MPNQVQSVDPHLQWIVLATAGFVILFIIIRAAVRAALREYERERRRD